MQLDYINIWIWKGETEISIHYKDRKAGDVLLRKVKFKVDEVTAAKIYIMGLMDQIGSKT